MDSILEAMYPFCREARNKGNASENGKAPTPRVSFILALLEKFGIKKNIDAFSYTGRNNFYNIILPGTSKYIITAHHDIMNPDSDNANDNSASVINAIYLKSLMPEARVVLTDGEEIGLIGATRLAEQINQGVYGDIEGVINLELSGLGGENFIIGDNPGKINDLIIEMFNPTVIKTPVSDTTSFRMAGIDSTVLNPLPLLTEGVSFISNDRGFLDNRSWSRCHTDEDSLDHISLDDMSSFVNNILVPILRS
jgi:hypothetical protein